METALFDMGQKTDLEILEENFAALENEIRELNLSALQAMKSLGRGSKTGSTAFALDRYKDQKQRLLDRRPLFTKQVIKRAYSRGPTTKRANTTGA